jgi:hypothetical protein
MPSIPRIGILYKATYSMAILCFNIFMMWIFFSIFDIEMSPDHIQLWLLGAIFVEIAEISLILSRIQKKE